MTITELAALMGVAARDAADFVAGVKLQMDRGLSLDAAIVAHREQMVIAFEHMAKRADNAEYSERMRSFAVDTFFPVEA